MKIDFQKNRNVGTKQEKALTFYGYFWTMFTLGKGKVGDVWYFVSIATLFGVFKIPLEWLPITAVAFVVFTVLFGIVLTKKFIAQKEQEVATQINPVFMDIIQRLERVENQLNKVHSNTNKKR